MSASDECFTPAEWIDRARAVLGGIDLDPCSSDAAAAVVGAARHYTIDCDGLTQPWAGRVWLNPPYSRAAPWVDRLLDGYESGAVSSAVALLNARTGSGWFARLSSVAWRCEKRKRIAFWGPATSGGAGFVDSVFFYIGPAPDRFAGVFADVGTVVGPALAVTQGVTRCAVCCRSMLGRRADAVVCSSACRQRRHRRSARPVNLSAAARG